MLTNSPLIITGMHRSGTSMISKYLNTAGLKLGESLLSANEHNPHGYFEDKEIVELQGKILKDACKDGYKGWSDWGYTEDLKLDKSTFNSHVKEAKTLINKKNQTGIWGWKDPRSTLLLDFWINLIPNAKVLGIYRNPWEVKQSMLNLNASVFSDNPHYAYEIWALYNSNLLAFAKSHPDKTLIVSSNGFIQNPKKLTQLLTEKWNLAFDENKINNYSFYDSKLFSGLSNTEFINEFFIDNKKSNLLDELNLKSELVADIKNETIDMNKVSVVIPCYNQGKYILDALNSLNASRNEVKDIVIINDGSDDSPTINILNKLNATNIRIINQSNMGLANARNKGIQECYGEYILFLDADNKVDPNYLTEAINILDNNQEIGVVYGNPRFFEGSSLMRSLDDFNIHSILCQNYIDACTVIRKAALVQVSGFDENMPISGYEDWELWINLFKHNWKFHHINKFLFDYRVKQISMVSNSNLPENREKNMAYLCNKHESIYTQNVKDIFPMLMKNYAEMENLNIERQKVIEEQAKIINNNQSNKLANTIKNNKFLNKIIKQFMK